jgi:hypothetical protein
LDELLNRGNINGGGSGQSPHHSAALFSLVTVLAHQFLQGQETPIRTAAWYASKWLPTFSDTLAFVRQQRWPGAFLGTSQEKTDVIEIPRSLFERLMDKVELRI